MLKFLESVPPVCEDRARTPMRTNLAPLALARRSPDSLPVSQLLVPIMYSESLCMNRPDHH